MLSSVRTASSSSVEASSIAKTNEPKRWALLPTVLAGSYAWIFTVLPLALAEPGSPFAGITALLALAVLIASLALPPGRWAMRAALDAFIALCLLSWWLARDAAVQPAYPIFGSFGWIAYTLALGALSTPRSNEALAESAPLRPRTPPSRLSAVILLGALAAALSLSAFAWRIDRPAIAVLGHVFALVAALILLRTAAGISVFYQRRGTQIPSRLSLRRALLPIGGLLCLLVGAALWILKFGGKL